MTDCPKITDSQKQLRSMFIVKIHTVEEPQEEGSILAALSQWKTSASGRSHDNKQGFVDEGSIKSLKVPKADSLRGVMHIFRNVSSNSGNVAKEDHNGQLCVLAVPRHFSPSDFCQFSGSFIDDINEMRILRNDEAEDRYTVFLKFSSQCSANGFYSQCNGKPFSSLQEEICHLLFIADTQYFSSEEQAGVAPFGLTELPTCPVCLERLDEHISGIQTTLCDNSFHTSCTSKWADLSCSACRHCTTSETYTCSACSTSENLWICLICGFLGCGRYQERHAFKHWQETAHCYSLELGSQQVWDYVGDKYVHRLIQSKSDGKFVELDSSCNDGGSSCEFTHGTDVAQAVFRSKLEALDYEYNYLLTTQLESQRKYYESLLVDIEDKTGASISEAVEKALEAKSKEMNMRLEKCEERNKFLRQVNQSLCSTQREWKIKCQEVEERLHTVLKEKDEQISDLVEQVRDFTIFVEAQKTIASSTEVKDGSVLALPASATKSKGSRTTRAGRKNRRP